MKIVFFGTPNYVIPVLDKLHKSFKSKPGESPIVAVVTQPPKPVGRKQLLQYSPVDTWAHKKKIPIYFEALDLIKNKQPRTKSPRFSHQGSKSLFTASLHPWNKIPRFSRSLNKIKADVGVLAAYGAIIPKEVIEYFPHGILNIHPSLLPKWRGSSPVQATLVSQDMQTGVTIIKIDELLDHGPIISQFKEDVLPEDTTGTLRARLFERSAEALATLIPAYLEGKITLRKQDHKKATFTSIIKKDHAYIPPEFLNNALQGETLKKRWEMPFIKDYAISPGPYAEGTSFAYTLERFIRAMQPWPVAWTSVQLNSKSKIPNPKRLKILKAHLEKSNVKGQVSNVLILDEIQLEGKNPVPWKQFKEAYPETGF